MTKKISIYAAGIAVCMSIASVAFAQDMKPAPQPFSPLKAVIRNIRNALIRPDAQNDDWASPGDNTQIISNDLTLPRSNAKSLPNAIFITATKASLIKAGATIIRLQEILKKLDSRIAKENSAGTDTTDAENDSSDAKVAITAAQINLSNIQSILVGIATSTDIDAATSTIHAEGQDLQTQLQRAQNNIQDALQSLGGL